MAYDSWNGKVFLLGILEQVQNIITSDDAGLAGQNVLHTHVCEGKYRYSELVNLR